MVDQQRIVGIDSLVLAARQAEDFLPLAAVGHDPHLLEAVVERVVGIFAVDSCGLDRRSVVALPLIHAFVNTDSWRSVTLRPLVDWLSTAHLHTSWRDFFASQYSSLLR